MHDALPSTQAELYAESWRKNQKELQAAFAAENQTATELEALTKSYAHATGQEKCSVNMPAAAWFWFTVMSTVGYGNQVPATVGGRLLTCTLGFFSILLFGGVLATAGGITAHVMNDFVHRFKTTVSRGAMVLLWGALWLLWMLVISFQAASYRNQRMQEEFPMNDAYWFAFISTTTVGFGDYYMQPEGLFVSDLLGLWGNFLVGFVLLSAFLTEISLLLGGWVPNLSDDLQQNLKYAYEDKAVPEEILQQQSLRRASHELRKSERRDSLRDSLQKKTPRMSIIRRQESDNGRDWSHPVLSAQGSTAYLGSSRRRVASPTLLQPNDNEEGQTASSNNSQEELLGDDDEQDRDQERQQRQQRNQAKDEKKRQAPTPGIVAQRRAAFNPTLESIPSSNDCNDASNRSHNPLMAASASPGTPNAATTPPKAASSPSKAVPAPPKSAPETPKPQSLVSNGFNPASPPQNRLFGHKSSPASEKAAKERARAAAPPKVNSGASAPPKTASNLQPGAPPPPAKAASNIQSVVTFVNKGTDPSMAKAELYYKATRWGPLGHGDPAVAVSTYPGDQWYIVANGVYAKMFTVAQGSQQQTFTI